MRFVAFWRGEAGGDKPAMRHEYIEASDFGDAGQKFMAKHKGEVGVPVGPTFKRDDACVMDVLNGSGRALVSILMYPEFDPPEVKPTEAKMPTVRKGGE